MRAAAAKLTHLLLFSSIYKRNQLSGAAVKRFAVPSPALIFIAQGSAVLHIDQTCHLLKPNQLYFLIPGMQLELAPSDNPCSYYVIFMNYQTISSRKPTNHAALDPHSSFHPLLPGRIALNSGAALLEQLKALHLNSRNKVSNRFVLNSQFQMLLHTIISHTAEQHQGDNAEAGIMRSIHYMHNHFAAKIRLETLAELAGFTPTSYSREFKKLLASSPMDYLNTYRLNHSKQLLLEKNHSIKDISVSSGFGSEFYYSRMFKRETGISPTLYMKRKDCRVTTVSCLPFEHNLLSLGSSAVYATSLHRDKTMNQDIYQQLFTTRLNGIKSAAADVIICDHYHLPYMEQFKQIAPTITIGSNKDWKQIHWRLAEIIGRESQAAVDLRAAEQLQSKARAELINRYGQQTVAVFRIINRLIRIQGAINHPLNHLIHTELGLRPGSCVPLDLMRAEFSPDKYPELDADHLFRLNYFYEEDEHFFDHLQQTAKWHSSKAGAQNPIRSIPNWVGMSWYPQGRKLIMEQLLQG